MDLSPDYVELLDRYPAQIEQLGGRAVTGFALQPSTTATSIRGDVVTDGPFIEAKEVVAGFFILEAPDLDTALRIAKLNPATRKRAPSRVGLRARRDGASPTVSAR